MSGHHMASLFMARRASTLLLTLTVAVIPVAAASAQSARLVGTVVDPSGAAVPDAAVTVVNPATSATTAAVTDASGLYVFPEIAPARYRVDIAKSGFRTAVFGEVVLNVATTLTLDAVLELGDVAERVEVTAVAPLVNRQSGGVGTVVDRTFVENLPLNGRSFQSLLEWMIQHQSFWATTACQSCHSNPERHGAEVTSFPLAIWWAGERYSETLASLGAAPAVRHDASAALEKHPDDVHARLRLAYALRALGDHQGFERELRALPWAAFPDRPYKEPRDLITFP